MKTRPRRPNSLETAMHKARPEQLALILCVQAGALHFANTGGEWMQAAVVPTGVHIDHDALQNAEREGWIKVFRAQKNGRQFQFAVATAGGFTELERIGLANMD